MDYRDTAMDAFSVERATACRSIGGGAIDPAPGAVIDFPVLHVGEPDYSSWNWMCLVSPPSPPPPGGVGGHSVAPHG